MIQDDLTCQELVELVTDYLEGRLSSEERARFEAHLADCPYCGIYLEQIRQLIRALGRLTEDTIPTSARDELLQVFRDWKRGRGLS